MQRKIRWIEAAAVPSGHLSFCYYLEADKGHVMEETLHRPEQRFIFNTPYGLLWDEITYLESYTLGLFDILFNNHQREYNQDVVRQKKNIVVYGRY